MHTQAKLVYTKMQNIPAMRKVFEKFIKKTQSEVCEALEREEQPGHMFISSDNSGPLLSLDRREQQVHVCELRAWCASAQCATCCSALAVRALSVQHAAAYKMCQNVQNGPKWSKMVTKCPKMVQNSPKWSKMVQNVSK